MFLSLESYVVAIIIVIVAVQYACALFCLLKLAYIDITKREYVLWNLFILLVFFIGDIVFLVYYFKKGKDRKIPPYVPPVENDENKQEAEDGASEVKAEEVAEATEEQPTTEAPQATENEAEGENQEKTK